VQAVGGQGVLFHRKGQGLRAYRVRRQCGMALAIVSKAQRLIPSIGFREEECAVWNRRKLANIQHSNVLERPSGDGECPTGMRAWGRRSAPRGF